MATNTYVDLPRMKEAQALSDYTGIHYDLFSARLFADLYLQEWPKSQSLGLLDPLMVATVVRYARSFVGGTRIKLPTTILTSNQLVKHKYLLTLRDKYIAHSVNSFEESQPIARYWIETVDEEGIDSVECMHARIAGLSPEEFKDIISLIDAWLIFVKQRLEEEKARLLAIVRTLPREAILKGYKGPVNLDTSQPHKRRKPFTR